MDENQRSHVIEQLGIALGGLAKAREWLDDETGWMGQALNSAYADLAEILDGMQSEDDPQRKEVPPTTTR